MDVINERSHWGLVSLSKGIKAVCVVIKLSEIVLHSTMHIDLIFILRGDQQRRLIDIDLAVWQSRKLCEFLAYVGSHATTLQACTRYAILDLLTSF